MDSKIEIKNFRFGFIARDLIKIHRKYNRKFVFFEIFNKSAHR
jgi:hypothetical protein